MTKKELESMDCEELDELVRDMKEEEASNINNDGCEELDEEVHDMKGEEAANINNAGREAQIEYLISGVNDMNTNHGGA